jgi:hypothetical protein
MSGVFERNGEARAAKECYEAAFHDGDQALRRRAALPYAHALELGGEHARAIEVLELALALAGSAPTSWRERAESRLRRLLRLSRTRLVADNPRRGARAAPLPDLTRRDPAPPDL